MVGVLVPPVGLVLARDAREIPGPGPRWVYEPKFDGWRAVVFAALGVVQSRRNNDLAARFPEIVAAARALGDVVADGELVALREGRLDFGSLAVMPRARAAAGMERCTSSRSTLLAVGDDDVRGTPLPVRRARLEKVFAEARPPLQLTPSIQDRAATELWMRSESAEVGIEGVVAKKVRQPVPGRPDR